MQNARRHAYVLRFQASELFLSPESESLDTGTEYVVPFSGHVIYRREDSEQGLAPNERDQIVGRFGGYVIHAGRAINDGVDLWDHCDAHSQELCDYATAFYDEEGGFKEELEDAFGGPGEGSNLLIIDEIALHPDHRGHGVGLRVLHRLLNVLGDGCAFAATIPYPLQFQEGEVGEFERHPERNRKRAEEQLALYVDRLGFEPLPNTRIYAASLTLKLPSLDVASRPAKVLPLLLKTQREDAKLPSP